MTDSDTIRLDKWLWHARFFKSRSLAAKRCADGAVRIDGAATTKAHFPIRVGSVLTFAQARTIRVVRVLALGVRRGPPVEARMLYEELVVTPPLPRAAAFRVLPDGARPERDR